MLSGVGSRDVEVTCLGAGIDVIKWQPLPFSVSQLPAQSPSPLSSSSSGHYGFGVTCPDTQRRKWFLLDTIAPISILEAKRISGLGLRSSVGPRYFSWNLILEGQPATYFLWTDYAVLPFLKCNSPKPNDDVEHIIHLSCPRPHTGHSGLPK